jgi:uncharacterized membrane protein YkvA (DUF1232 family)
MTELFSTIRLLIGGVCLLLTVFLVLLALPKSKLRDLVMPFVGWGVAALSAMWIVSPLDPMPDVIPVLGFADDLVMLAIAIGSAMSASSAWKRLKQLN